MMMAQSTGRCRGLIRDSLFRSRAPSRSGFNEGITRKPPRPCSAGFIKSRNLAVYGQYCLYHTLSPILPPNKTCERMVGAVPSLNQLFWRGDVLIIRYDGHPGHGHVYNDVQEALVTAVEKLLRKAYESGGLERVHKEYESFSLQEEVSKTRIRFPELMDAIESGALEKLRTGQLLDEADIQAISEIPLVGDYIP